MNQSQCFTDSWNHHGLPTAQNSWPSSIVHTDQERENIEVASTCYVIVAVIALVC